MKLEDLLNEYSHDEESINEETSLCGIKDIVMPIHNFEEYLWDRCGAECALCLMCDENARDNKGFKIIFLILFYGFIFDLIAALIFVILFAAGVFH